MKKYLAFFVLAFTTGTAIAGACKSYWDAEGFERFQGDPEKLTAAFIADMEARVQVATPDIVIHWPQDEKFVVHDRTNNIVKHCTRANGMVHCH